MDGLRFEWDRRKETANRKKHGVSFTDAKTAFLDEMRELSLIQTTLTRKIALSSWA
jgi:uncharacterized DUF497 family protein